MSVLNDRGRFIEIGKQGIWSKQDVAEVKPNINYFIVDLWRITQDQPELIQQMLRELRLRFRVAYGSQFNTDQLKPLPYTVFPSDKIIDAFRYMQQGKHQGKIVITPSSRHPVTPSFRRHILNNRWFRCNWFRGSPMVNNQRNKKYCFTWT